MERVEDYEMGQPRLAAAFEAVNREMEEIPEWLREIYRRNGILERHQRERRYEE